MAGGVVLVALNECMYHGTRRECGTENSLGKEGRKGGHILWREQQNVSIIIFILITFFLFA